MLFQAKKYFEFFKTRYFKLLNRIHFCSKIFDKTHNKERKIKYIQEELQNTLHWCQWSEKFEFAFLESRKWSSWLLYNFFLYLLLYQIKYFNAEVNLRR